MMSLQRNTRNEQSKAKHRLVDLHMQQIGSDQPFGRGRILA